MRRKLLFTSDRKVSPGVHKTDVSGLQTLLRDKIGIWAINGNCVEEIWNNFKEIVSESIESFVPHKILRKNPDRKY